MLEYNPTLCVNNLSHSSNNGYANFGKTNIMLRCYALVCKEVVIKKAVHELMTEEEISSFYNQKPFYDEKRIIEAGTTYLKSVNEAHG